ncbi:MAG TPA: HNH endonuclease signature motif containing protein [Actinomycetota bacterium]|nr:HNH endonuclease signature motif containing protein [Actinomycetota bacterium]
MAAGGRDPAVAQARRHPSQPLNLGRSSRVIAPGQQTTLAARDGGCVVPDCTRPLAWCEGHHLVSWLDGGPTDLPNLALLCRAHHRAVHEAGWRLQRAPDGRFTATPPQRRSRRQPGHHRRQPAGV